MVSSVVQSRQTPASGLGSALRCDFGRLEVRGKNWVCPERVMFSTYLLKARFVAFPSMWLGLSCPNVEALCDSNLLSTLKSGVSNLHPVVACTEAVMQL